MAYDKNIKYLIRNDGAMVVEFSNAVFDTGDFKPFDPFSTEDKPQSFDVPEVVAVEPAVTKPRKTKETQ